MRMKGTPKMMTEHAQKAPLPIPLAEARALPVLSAPARLSADLRQFERASWRSTDLPALRRAAPAARALREQFAAVDRPADADAVATAALIATTTMPMSNGIDPGRLAQILCEDLAEMGATVFELERALRELRWSKDFFSLPALGRELRRARRLARDYRRALDIDRRIAEHERALQYEQEAEDARGRARAELDQDEDEEEGGAS